MCPDTSGICTKPPRCVANKYIHIKNFVVNVVKSRRLSVTNRGQMSEGGRKKSMKLWDGPGTVVNSKMGKFTVSLSRDISKKRGQRSTLLTRNVS